MPEFVWTHGSIKTPAGVIGVGDSISLTEAEAKAYEGALMPKALYDAEQKAAKAGAAAKAEALKEHAEPKPKGGGK